MTFTKTAGLLFTALLVGFVVGRRSAMKDEADQKPQDPVTAEQLENAVGLQTPKVDQAQIPVESTNALGAIEIKSPDEVLSENEITALEFARSLQAIQAREEEIVAPANTELFVKFERENDELLALALRKNQIKTSIDGYLRHLQKIPSQTSTLTDLMRVLNRSERYQEAVSYCKMGRAHISALRAELTIAFADNCAEAYRGAGFCSEAVQWKMYSYEWAKNDDGVRELRMTDAAFLADCFGQMGDNILQEKYQKIACELGDKAAC